MYRLDVDTKMDKSQDVSVWKPLVLIGESLDSSIPR